MNICFLHTRFGLLVSLALLAIPVANASADFQSEYDRAKDLGAKAYVYGIPLLNMEKTFKTQTSVNVPDGRGDAPVNQFSYGRQLTSPLDRTVVSPNHDTLYSIAWLNLSVQPIVVHVPDTGSRFNVVPLMEPYEEVFEVIGVGAPGIDPPGDYVIVPPHKRLETPIPPGLNVVHAPYDRVWIIMRTLVKDKADEANVNAIQDATRLVPLSKWRSRGLDYQPKPPKSADTTVNPATIPGTQPGEDSLDFFDALGAALKQFKPPAADRPLLEELSTVGIGIGKTPSKNKQLSAATVAGLRDAVAAGKAKVNETLVQSFVAGFGAHNGWLVGRTGNYGTNYDLRAVVDQIGLGALPSNVAIYPYAQTDRLLQPLDGATNRYVAHFNPPGSPFVQQPIPADAFWSLTLYDASRFFVPNPIDRYLLNDRSDLHYNPDGSLDIYLQNQQPGDPDQVKNWLPTPRAPFNLIFRLYGPPAGLVDGIISGSGWKGPTILPCGPNGYTPAFSASGINAPIACAS
jgi:hypothetical protein